ncbi:unnamed protein product [Pedinophyceae sp. YPF-701]|nr:unnamed protein product [Pedinophyceae sp. YPF-701]
MTSLDEYRAGTVRASMKTNALLQPAELGKPKRILFNNPPPSRVFGMPKKMDAESSRDVIMYWQEHRGAADEAPGPDFCTMNKLATINGNVTAKQHADFRKSNPVALPGAGETTRRTRATLPSDRDRRFTYGCPSSYKPLEVLRRTGEDCDMQSLMQGAYVYEWVRANQSKEAIQREQNRKIEPRATLATEGHARGSAMRRAGRPVRPSDTFKMKRFAGVKSKLTASHEGAPEAAAEAAEQAAIAQTAAAAEAEAAAAAAEAEAAEGE